MPILSWSGRTYHCQRYFADNALTTVAGTHESLNVVVLPDRKQCIPPVGSYLYKCLQRRCFACSIQHGDRMESGYPPSFLKRREVIQTNRTVSIGGNSRLPSFTIHH